MTHPEVSSGAGGSARVITVFSAKGGVGKTTLAANLAAYLAKGSRVCLVDLDLTFGDVAISLQLAPRRTILDAAEHAGAVDEVLVQSLVMPYGAGFDVLAAPPDPASAVNVSPELITELLSVMNQMYEFVVVDSPPDFTEAVLAAFDLTDHFVLVGTPDVAAVKNLKLTIETLDALGYPHAARTVVLNRADSRVGIGPRDVAGVIGTPVDVVVPADAAVPTTANRGITIVRDQPGSKVSRAIATLADKAAPPATSPASSGMRRRISVHGKRRRWHDRRARTEISPLAPGAAA